MQVELQQILLEEKKLIEMHCPDFAPLDSEYKVYEGVIFYKLRGKVSAFKVLMEIPTDFPHSAPKFKALQKSTWHKIHPNSGELDHSFFEGNLFKHVYSYILFFKGQFLEFIHSNSKKMTSRTSSVMKAQQAGLADDLSYILTMARHNSQGKWINKEMLIERSRWNLDRINRALNILEQENIARKIVSRSVGTRWYFPGA
ncbi:MAG: hypothetical protein ACTSVY_03415 [Candidatus Helarchaeota archaeon]